MKDIILAETAGFCFGVKRAVDKVYELSESEEKVYTYGPIIHNDEVVKDLEFKGIITLRSEEELKSVKDGIVVIRSHGVPKYINDYLDDNNIKYVDMTCPFVKRIHNIVSSEKERAVVIAGSPVHPEVMGICGWCNGEATVIETEEQAVNFAENNSDAITLASQTTFNFNKFKEFVEIFQKKGYDVNVVNTICDATRKRQCEAHDIAVKADVMIVIGDKHSSNSRKLYDICSKECEDSCFVQTLTEFMSDEFQGIRDKLCNVHTVGITAGASTPNKIIEEVQNYVRTNF